MKETEVKFKEVCNNIWSFTFPLYKKYKHDRWIIENMMEGKTEITLPTEEVLEWLNNEYANRVVLYFETAKSNEEVKKRMNAIVYLSMIIKKKFTNVQHVTLRQSPVSINPRFYTNTKKQEILLTPIIIEKIKIPYFEENKESIDRCIKSHRERGFTEDRLNPFVKWFINNEIQNYCVLWLKKMSYFEIVTDSNPQIIWQKDTY